MDASALANKFSAGAKAFHEAVVPGDWKLLGVAGKAGLVAEGDVWLGQQEIKAADRAGTRIENGAKVVNGATWAGTQVEHGADWAGTRIEHEGGWAVDTASDGVGTAVIWGKSAASDVVGTLSPPVRALTIRLP